MDAIDPDDRERALAQVSKGTVRRFLLSAFFAGVIGASVKSPQAQAQDTGDGGFLNGASLLKHGFTLGIGPVVLATQRLGNKFKQTDVGFTAMPYIAVLPGYFANMGPQAREYCGTRAIFLSKKAARDKADESARSDTRAKLQRDGAVSDAEVFNATEWKVGVDQACVGTWFGVYFGFPLSFEAAIKNADGDSRQRDMSSRGSFGFAFVPTVYTNVLLGISRVVAKLPVDASSEEVKLVHGWAYTLGFGGTLDVFAGLFQ